MSTQNFALHPATLKHIRKGHPWVIEDSYTKKFPHRSLLLFGGEKNRPAEVLFLNDPLHPKIKGRLWSLDKPNFKTMPHTFWEEFERRVSMAISSREGMLKSNRRENIYLIFGEADYIPGLFVQRLGKGLLIQSYTSIWRPHKKKIANTIDQYSQADWILWQDRFPQSKNEINPVKGAFPKGVVIKETGLSFKLDFGQGHDYGLYTDMAAIREGLDDIFQNKKSVLNLYSYTGAFSLKGLKENSKVTSVDLSSRYLNWLEYNISLNPSLEKDQHRSLCSSTDKALAKLTEEQNLFDLIICDPPSSSTDGKKRITALKSYEQDLPRMIELLEKGGHLILFLNTHSIARKRFVQKIRAALHPNIKVVRELALNKDCPRLKGFPEGDYLKGIVLQKN
jgi:23S rRNA (cytosine1962-C5)-methyltransferase